MSGSNLVILTGAGISAESGVATFRDPDGVWAGYDLQDVTAASRP
jgi:NAD-dependent deacetylase